MGYPAYPRIFVSILVLCACGQDPDIPRKIADDGGTHGGPDGGAAGRDGSADDPPHAPQPTQFAGCLDGLVAPESGFIEVLSFVASEPNLKVMRARQPGNRSAVGETFPYDLVGVAIQTDDEEACIFEAAQLSYTFGHHNWSETWTLRTKHALYTVREAYSFDNDELPWKDTIEAHSLTDNTRLWGPIPLEADGCFSLPYNLNPCMKRTRTDTPPEGWGTE